MQTRGMFRSGCPAAADRIDPLPTRSPRPDQSAENQSRSSVSSIWRNAFGIAQRGLPA